MLLTLLSYDEITSFLGARVKNINSMYLVGKKAKLEILATVEKITVHFAAGMDLISRVFCPTEFARPGTRADLFAIGLTV